MIWVCKMTMFMTGVTILKEMDDIQLERRLVFVDTSSSHPMEREPRYIRRYVHNLIDQGIKPHIRGGILCILPRK